MQTEECRARLLDKANSLPLTPGVYLMRDVRGKVIYVGKSRKLKNRVSQYFPNGEKNYKTARMVALVADFDYFLCDTEIEALALENTLIKQYAPKYNIRLKDAKSYPYIKITDELYPRLVF
ncbi:MAG: GIY-YIG nuclease family protein, partial [Clostridia bacterium]|nr:GIY-YIG nuclease family protein [Clostridia bacterium]